MNGDHFLPLSRDDVRDLWQRHSGAPNGEATPDAPWAFVHALFTVWRRAEETRQSVLMGWTSTAALEALQPGDGSCHVYPLRTQRGASVPVGVLHHAPVGGANER